MTKIQNGVTRELLRPRFEKLNFEHSILFRIHSTALRTSLEFRILDFRPKAGVLVPFDYAQSLP